MAYLYRKKRSPFWYVQYPGSDRKKHDKSTGLRADDPNVWARRSHDLGAIPRDRRNRQQEPNGQLQYATFTLIRAARWWRAEKSPDGANAFWPQAPNTIL